MVDLLPLLIKATSTLQGNMARWFSQFPTGMPWMISSDYCIGDDNKNNDVFSYVVLAYHNKIDNIRDYIAAVAPKDIKKTKTIPPGLVQYLNCPAIFSISFVIDRKSALLRNYLRVEDMANFVPEVCEFIDSMRRNTPPGPSVDPAYFDEAQRRFDLFGKELSQKQPSERRARQIHLASAFAATVFYCVTKATQPGYLGWISDRDALIERHDTVVFDLATVYFHMMASSAGLLKESEGRMVVGPQLIFHMPEKTGKHSYEELIRLPDYLAGTLADIDLKTMAYTKEKFGVMLHSVLVNSPNNCVVQMLSVQDRITARSIGFQL